MAVRIVCDTCADLPLSMLRDRNITSIPLTVSFGSEQLKDGVDITPERFYERLKASKVMPTTSQVVPAQFAEVFGPQAAGGDEVVYVGLSSGLSGSYQSSAVAAAAPELGGRVHVVDSLGASVGLGLMVLRAADLAAAGKTGAEIAHDLQDFRARVCHVFTLDTLEYARRGGRVSAFSAMAASVLDVKPVLRVDMAGKLIPFDRVRGRKKAIARLFDELERLGADPRDQRVGISHSSAEDEALELAHRFRTKYGAREVVLGQIGATVGAHVGPGCLSIFFEGPVGRGE
ncbi:MAG: degV family protein [Symbiobacteriaceae bacterium]|jgi:DegV family protein with EDD domain|nr:degV family protein [Symbiobacteriaceae bacterium]